MTRRARSGRGFTLLELLVVVVIVSILAAIAIPLYREHVSASRRIHARTALLDVASHQARHMTMNGTYTDAPAKLGFTGGRFPVDVPGGPGAWYRINVTLTTRGGGFEATAQPINAQSADRCGVFVLDDIGRQSNRGATVASSQCW